ncbi:MAG: serine hydrolase [Solirubrobacteraceae bacterium]|nr:MAG: hypothetical protein DLM63_09640 [Solirubrobacterales bacterium]
MRRGIAVAGLLLVVAAMLPGVAAAAPVQIAISATKTEVAFGSSTTIVGQVQGSTPAPGQTVEVDANPYPYYGWHGLSLASVRPDGSFSAVVTPQLNTRYRVVYAAAGLVSPTISVVVDDAVTPRLSYLPLGRVQVSIFSAHPADLPWGGRRAYWFVAEGSSARFVLATITHTRRVGAGTSMTAVLPVNAGRFRYLECFTAPSRYELALGLPSAHPACPQRDFTAPSPPAGVQSATDFQGIGFAPAGFPFAGRIASARHYLQGRAGVTGFAVVDSEGRLSGWNMHRTFVSASVVKAMLLVAYLNMLSSQHRGLDDQSRSILFPMINVSDNSAATSVWSIVGDGSLDALARRAGMTDFSISGIWANAQISPADQARFFFEMDQLIPPQFRGYARFLLSTIVGYESWGIPAVARPAGWTVYFKGGWRGTGLGQLVHQSARLQRGPTTWSLAVMTDGDPSMSYGIDTIQGVTARLL